MYTATGKRCQIEAFCQQCNFRTPQCAFARLTHKFIITYIRGLNFVLAALVDFELLLFSVFGVLVTRKKTENKLFRDRRPVQLIS